MDYIGVLQQYRAKLRGYVGSGLDDAEVLRRLQEAIPGTSLGSLRAAWRRVQASAVPRDIAGDIGLGGVVTPPAAAKNPTLRYYRRYTVQVFCTQLAGGPKTTRVVEVVANQDLTLGDIFRLAAHQVTASTPGDQATGSAPGLPNLQASQICGYQLLFAERSE